MAPNTCSLHRIWLNEGGEPTPHDDAHTAMFGDANLYTWTTVDIAADPRVAWALETRWYKESRFKRVLAAKDFMRLVILNEYGGIYSDWDVEWLRTPWAAGLWPRTDGKLVAGYEDENWLCNAVIMSPPKHPVLADLVEKYAATSYNEADEKLLWQLRGPVAFTLLCKLHADKVEALPPEYFYPMHWHTRVLRKTERTICVHYYGDSPTAVKS